MELRINLATASLKDAEHAIFLIGAYFGMTNLPNAVCQSVVRASETPAAVPPTTPYPAPVVATATGPAPLPDVDPASVFGGAGEGAVDPAAVFGGNVASPAPVATQGMPAMPTPSPATAAPSAPTVAAPVGSPAAPAPAPAASAPPGVELDAAGLPWDGRIHASGEGGAKPKNADGKWRKKRGLNDAAFVGKVEGELRATLAAGTPAAAPAAPIPPATVMPVAPPAPTAPAGPPTTFEQLMPRITGAITAGIIPKDALLQAVTAYQLPNIPALATRPDMVPTVWAYLQAVYPALQ